MENTLKMFKSINNQDYNKYTYEELSELYKLTPNPQIIANAFIRLSELIYLCGTKFFYISDDDLSSISVKRLNDCLFSYDNTKNASFVTYFNNGLYKDLLAESYVRSHDKRILNYDIKLVAHFDEFNKEDNSETNTNYCSQEYKNSFIYEGITDLTCLSIQQSTELTDREKQLCYYIMNTPANCTKQELSDVLGVTRPTIYTILKSLKIKLQNLLLT